MKELIPTSATKDITPKMRRKLLWWAIACPKRWESFVIRVIQGCTIKFAYERTKSASKKELNAFLKISKKDEKRN